jgi:hypothetical protein
MAEDLAGFISLRAITEQRNIGLYQIMAGKACRKPSPRFPRVSARTEGITHLRNKLS